MKRNLTIVLSIFTSLLFGQDANSTYDRQAAQNYEKIKPGKSKFMIRGYYHTGLDYVEEGDESSSNYTYGSLNPILMYKQSDKLFFEAEFEGLYGSGGHGNEGGFQWGVEYSNMSYIINKNITARAGMFILPFGTFQEKLHPAWINRLATKPLGLGHDGISPTSDVGFELRGAFYAGSLKFNYQMYSINGPRLKVGHDEPEEAGMLDFNFDTDNNDDKSIGGRLGIFPFKNSSMEVGFSGLTGIVGDKGSEYENVRANLYAVDLSFVKNVNFIKSMIDIKGQYNYTQVDDAAYSVPGDTTGLFYDFNNVSSSYYAQLSIRPSMTNNNFIRKLEFVGRYSELTTPEGALWEQNPTQMAVGLNYWIDWRTVIKLGYQSTNGLGGHDGEANTNNLIYLHWAMGF